MIQSNKRMIGFAAALFLFGVCVWSGPAAQAADMPGDACTSLGATTIAVDRTSIIACLLKTAGVVSDPPCKVAGECRWKSMTGGGGGVPVGSVIAWPATIDPPDMDNWLECKGQTITKDTYPELFAVVGGQVPDFRGMFLRGLGSKNVSQNNGSIVGVTTTTHTSADLGKVQGDSIRNITATFVADMAAPWLRGLHDSGAIYSSAVLNVDDDGSLDNPAVSIYTLDASRTVPTSTENRPVNMSVRYLIRAKP